ncbi:protein FRIGIDA-ESSENTIAL 1-like isoform X2 [Pistacia vera]|uniref:protein FRIGIDA-ESSENTIAL 1-like isoform X2 n=1 Tax=Pistacia vera TaxID=55513 RepID=UPI001262D025|nr:protein FRIGIDA-ESSENTIAL 1-like isoform X2 [Pistacia vera]
MSTSSAAPSDDTQRPLRASHSAINDHDEIMEVEDEVDDSSDSPNHLSKEMESEGHSRHLGSGSSQGKSKLRLPSDVLAVEESKGNSRTSCSSNKPFKRQKKVSYEICEESKYPKSGKYLALAKDNGSLESEISKKDIGAVQKVRTPEDYEMHNDCEARFCDSEIMDAETTSPSSITRKNVAAAIPIRDRLDEGPSEEEIKQMDMHSGDDIRRMASRSASPAVRTRSLSPGAEIKDGNKRPVVICDFFTKGWCIKGNSCRFLHLKDDTNNTSQQPEKDAAAATVRTDAQFDEGLTIITDRSRLPCFPEPLASSVRNNPSLSSDLSLERILPQELGESKGMPQLQENHRFSSLQRENISLGKNSSSQGLASTWDDLGLISSFKDGGREGLRQNWSVDDYRNHGSLLSGGNSPMFRNSLLPEYRSSPSMYRLSDYSSLSHPLNSSLSTSGPTGGNLPSHHVSAWIGSSLPFNSSSLNASPLSAQKLFVCDRKCHTSKSSSLLKSSSPFSGSEPEKPLLSADHKTKVSSNDWEPSLPFRPSFFIDHTIISSPGSQYDPLHDGFDSPKIGDISLKVSVSSVKASTVNTPHHQIYGDSMLSRTIVPECTGDKSSVSSQCGFHENLLDQNCHTPGKDSHTGGEEAVGTSVDLQNVTMRKEADSSVSTCVKDISKSKKLDTSHDSRQQNDGSRCNKDLKADRVRQNSETDLEHTSNGDVQKESKAMRQFRSGLVNFVKELLKPTWREGKLNKDAHNRIVKKAVDKVLHALQPHQIPTTLESVKHYLSSSQPKIAKLIEGYVDKYGKS